MALPLLGTTRLVDIATPEEIKTMQLELETAQRVLANSTPLTAFDPSKPTLLATDGSGRGMGWALLQKERGDRVSIAAYDIDPDNIFKDAKIVAQGGRSTTDVESRYSAYKLELTAVTYGLRATDHFLRSGFFALLTDHRSLVRAFNMEDPAPVVVSMLDEINSYWFFTVHVTGKTFGIVDEISRLFESKPLKLQELDLARDQRTPAALLARGVPEMGAPNRFTQGSFSATTPDRCDGERPFDPRALKLKAGGVGVGKAHVPDDEPEPVVFAGPPGTYDSLLAKSASKAPITGKGRRDPEGRLYPPRACPGARVWRPGDAFHEVPAEDVDVIIAEVHLQGHIGVTAAVKRIHELGWTAKGLARKVHDYIQRCLVCLRWNVAQGGYTPRPWPWPTVGTTVAWSFDFSDLPKDGHNKSVVLIAVDVFSMFSRLYAVEDKTAKSAAEAFVDIVYTFGPPAYVVTDNATSFVNEVFAEVCARAGSEHRRITPYNHRGNTRAENGFNRAKRLLEKMLDGRYGEWSAILKPVEFIMNTTTLPGTDTSPYRLMFCRDPLPWRDYAEAFHEDVSEEHLQARLKEAEHMAAVVLPGLAERQYQLGLDKLRKPADRLVFKVGDVVMYRDRHQAEGFSKDQASPTYLGPAQVVVANGGAYTFLDNDGKVIKSTFLGGDLKRTGFDALDSDDVFEVRKIHDERPSTKEPGRIEFLVEWVGFPSEADYTWELDTNFLDRAVLTSWERSKAARQRAKGKPQGPAQGVQAPQPAQVAPAQPAPVGSRRSARRA
jgi:hypothetical protein